MPAVSDGAQKPSLPAAASKLELTPRAVVTGLVLSVIMAAANVYLGLKAGMTVSASIPAAVVGMLLLRGLFRDGTVLEANQIQTTASAGESLAAGIIFTVPALLLIGAWREFNFVTTTLIAFAGGLLGILFMIPMRRVFVVDNDELPYPEGVACAAVLETGDRIGQDAEATQDGMRVGVGAAIGAIFKLVAGYIGLFKGHVEAATLAGSRVLYLGSEISPALVGVGYIVGLNVAVLICMGGAIGWWVCIPLMGEIEALLDALGFAAVATPLPDDGVGAAYTIWSEKVRYIGVGAMVVGGAASIIKVRHGLVQAIRELKKRMNKRVEGSAVDDDADIPSKAILALGALALALIVYVYYQFTGLVSITLLSTVVMVVMSFFFVAVASYIVGLVGNSNSPVSGMTITAVLFTGAMLLIFGFTGMDGMVATLGVAAIVCCAACTSGDVCNDLKTGSLVGAAPRKQQIMQIAGVAVASLVMAPVLTLLHEAWGIGSKELSAPQAGLFASLAKGFFGGGALPWGLVLFGGVLGIVFQLADHRLEKKAASFRLHLMPIAVGIYLPFGISVPIFIGGVLATLVKRATKKREVAERGPFRKAEPPPEPEVSHAGVLFASGIIAGESLVGVLIAMLVVSFGTLDISFPGQSVLAIVAFVAVIGAFWHYARPARGGRPT